MASVAWRKTVVDGRFHRHPTVAAKRVMTILKLALPDKLLNASSDDAPETHRS
jgi:hypothetical protein